MIPLLLAVISVTHYLALAVLLVYVPLLWLLTINRNDDLLKGSFFRLLNSAGVCDCAGIIATAFLFKGIATADVHFMESSCWLMCPVSTYSVFALNLCADMHILAIGWNRYDAIVNALRYENLWSVGHRVRRVMTCCWVLPFVVWLPMLAMDYAIETNPQYNHYNASTFDDYWHHRLIWTNAGGEVTYLMWGVYQVIGATWLSVVYWRIFSKLQEMQKIKAQMWAQVSSEESASTAASNTSRRLVLIGVCLTLPKLISAASHAVIFGLVIANDPWSARVVMETNQIAFYVLLCQNPFIVTFLSSAVADKWTLMCADIKRKFCAIM